MLPGTTSTFPGSIPLQPSSRNRLFYTFPSLYPPKPLSPSFLSANNFISYFPRNIDAPRREFPHAPMYHILCHPPPASWPMCPCSHVRWTPMCAAHLMPSCLFKDIIPSALSQFSFLYWVKPRSMQIYCDFFFFFSLKNLSATKLLAATVPFTAVFLESLPTVNSIRMRNLHIRFCAVFPVFRIVPGQGSMQVFVEWILCLKFFSCCLWLNS